MYAYPSAYSLHKPPFKQHASAYRRVLEWLQIMPRTGEQLTKLMGKEGYLPIEVDRAITKLFEQGKVYTDHPLDTSLIIKIK